MKISGNLIDIINKCSYPVQLKIVNGKISELNKVEYPVTNQYILPGFIDAHVHIESSMLTPTEFARLAVSHGTVATISDPHEIANVLGVEGIEYMIDNAGQSPFKFYFGAPSCVPATTFETAGAEINVEDIDFLLQKEEIKYLAEMMNWPGVLNKDPIVLEKIKIAQKFSKPIDGHAPGLRGKDAINYIASGISTDHECFTKEEALEKLKAGMKIIIREGSAAKNFEALVDLIDDHYDHIMFCSDDKHPDSLVEGHINVLIKRALNKGIDLFKILKVACINPVDHYNLDVGLLRLGDPADFVIIDNPKDFNVLQTYIDGQLVAERKKSKLLSIPTSLPNNFNATFVERQQFEKPLKNETIPVIEVMDGELITKRLDLIPKKENGLVIQDVDRDILKIAVVNRYKNASPSVAFVKNFGLQKGAIASSVAHDSHNIIVVGVDDNSMAEACNLIIKNKGGLSAYTDHQQQILALPIAGLMSNQDGYQVAEEYKKLDQLAKSMGSNLLSPYMALSFMALLVIPSIKLSDQGLFDGAKFEFIE